MSVREVLILACEFLNLKELKTQLDSNNVLEGNQERVENLLNCFNLIYEEIATEYFPMFKREELDKKDRIYFEDLSKKISFVFYVKNKEGSKLSFVTFPDHILFDGTASEIMYAYIPEKLELNSQNIMPLIPDRVYVYGILREYFLFKGLSDEAIYYENRFKESLLSLTRKKGVTKIPARKFL